MNSDLMLFESKNKIVVSSRIVAERFEKLHSHVLRDIQNYIGGISKIGDTPSKYFVQSQYMEPQNSQTYPEYFCTRDGFSILAMGFTGEKALGWKLKYVEAFNKMESALRERQTTDWLQTRERGKLIRREETDIIQQLIPYAEEQGSKNAKMFYVNYSKLVNKAVGLESGERGGASYKTLLLVALIEDMVSNTIAEEMAKGVYYKEIYQICKRKAEQFMTLAYLPRLAG